MARYGVEERLVWLNGETVPVRDARINVLAPTSQFGLNVFEGIPCFWSDERQELYAFRLEDHYQRLIRSAHLLHIECPYSPEEMTSALIDVVRANEYKEDLSVRQILFVDGVGSWRSTSPVGMLVAPIPRKHTSVEYNKTGLSCCISSWMRINENTMSPRIKCGANYINSRMAQLEAIRNGYDTAIFLNQQGKVAEGPGSCLFIVINGKLVTPLLTDSVLESITRHTVITIARDMGIEVEERAVDRTELYSCDEAFLCGSAMGITPVLSFDRYMVGNGLPGRLTQTVRSEYLRIATGLSEKYVDWLTPIA